MYVTNTVATTQFYCIDRLSCLQPCIIVYGSLLCFSYESSILNVTLEDGFYTTHVKPLAWYTSCISPINITFHIISQVLILK